MLTPGAIVSDLRGSFLIWGANCNNDGHVGAAFNVNNPFSNSNWNIGPSHAYLNMGLLTECLRLSLPRWALEHAYRKDRGKIKPAAYAVTREGASSKCERSLGDKQ